MNRYQFISLDRTRQLRVLRVSGKVVHRRLKKEYTSRIYQLENFYIEIWENTIKHKIVNLVTYKDSSLINYRIDQNQKRA